MQGQLKQRQVSTPSKNGSEDKKGTPRLPHERDESDASQADTPRPDIKQAFDDVENGLVDTDLRGSMGVDQATRAPGNTTKPTPPAPERNRDPNTRKLPDGTEGR